MNLNSKLNRQFPGLSYLPVTHIVILVQLKLIKAFRSTIKHPIAMSHRRQDRHCTHGWRLMRDTTGQIILRLLLLLLLRLCLLLWLVAGHEQIRIKLRCRSSLSSHMSSLHSRIQMKHLVMLLLEKLLLRVLLVLLRVLLPMGY
ncbi:hypothetical protein BX661DRAFT_176540 [Kickxella alabastrina]|uniref:uncharacterized protein n=1 Tax=Kickxella alabastrina TaxID=61397 RepID=UPI0022211CFA|nr:uncharacterized protein BX661DRAFT_176540 [Kickxella alabastrina]KAI7834050.1 hypothetical protein BX661DRAFT_176540 [Kickxella alabastrina]